MLCCCGKNVNSTRNGRWRLLVLTLWYSLLFSGILVYFMHFHSSASSLNERSNSRQYRSYFESLAKSAFNKMSEKDGLISLDKIKKRFSSLTFSRIFSGVVMDESDSPNLVEEILIEGKEEEVNHFLANKSSYFSGNIETAELEVLEKVPVTIALDSSTVHYDNITGKRPELPPEILGYTKIGSEETLRVRCPLCALISSSGHLLNSSAGKTIDSYPCVIRMNSATTREFEKDVGKRTNIRVIGMVNLKELKNNTVWQNELFIDKERRTEKVVIPWLYRTVINKTSDEYYLIAKQLAKKFPNVEFYDLTPEKLKRADDLFKIETGVSRSDAHTWLTTGWMSMLFAMDACEDIHVFGLAMEDHCIKHPKDKTPYHYYEPHQKTECSYYKTSEEKLSMGHKFMTEKAVFARWATRFNIKFRFPGWNLSNVRVNDTMDTPFLKMFKEAKKKGIPPGTVRKNGTRIIRRVVKRVIKKVVVRRKVPVVKKPIK